MGRACNFDKGSRNICALCAGNEIARKTNISPTEATVEFGPTLEEQKKLAQDKGKGLSGQFEVLYDVERDPTGGEVLVSDQHIMKINSKT